MPPRFSTTNIGASPWNSSLTTHRAWRWLGLAVHGVVCALFLSSAFAYAWTALCAEINFAWRQPMFDQWRLYQTFLSLPFPDNVLQLENGHRPIFPNLIRVGEIHWFAADQYLQIACGTVFAFLTAAVIALVMLREECVPFIARCAGAMLAVIGVLWLANSRMLLHGNESVHTYLLTLCVVGASLMAHRAARTRSFALFAVSGTACAVAMFCFGPGAASFVSIVLLALIMRLPLRWLLAPIAILAGCLILYVAVLPGSQGVRQTLNIHPLESLHIMAQWLSSPWTNGWLALADPRAGWVVLDKPKFTSHLLLTSANALSEATGFSWRNLGIAISFTGIAVFGLRTVFALWRGARTLSAWESVAIGVGSFALFSAAIFAVGRMDYLQSYPDQIYADRYMVWPSLFWCALALLLVFDLSRSPSKSARIAGTCFLVAMPFALWPAQRHGIEWASAVYRNAQESAAAVRSGVFDGDKFPDGADASRSTVLQTLDLLKRGHLAMFADPTWELIGKPCPWPMVNNKNVSAHVAIASRGTDSIDGASFAIVSGAVASGVAQIQKDGNLAIVDSNNVVVGLTEFSQLKPDSDALRFDFPRKRGFDGYIRHFDPRETYTLVLLAPDSQQAFRLTPIPVSK
ncbi:MAG: hypothetical protein JSS04_12075 [Proteobacteria bacterium]|nr:hypothetical protein [Pseudomonadota bacterium]